MKKKFVFFAPAKINLFLSVVGKRKDGYHLLQTVFRLINLCDEIQIKIRLDGRIRRIGGPSAIAPGEDLVLRAAFLLKKEINRSPSWQTTVISKQNIIFDFDNKKFSGKK